MSSTNLIHSFNDLADESNEIRVKTVRDGVQNWIASQMEISLFEWTPEAFKKSYPDYFMAADRADSEWYYKPEELATNRQRVDALIEGCWWAYEVKVDRDSLKAEFR